MKRTPIIRRAALVACAGLLTVAAGGPSAGAAPHRTTSAETAAVPPRPGQLRTLAGLSADRLATGDLVAAAKWGTGSPIDDPVREQQVLNAVAEQAREDGADPAATVRVFRDQIEANKDVQRGLFRRWKARPAEAPTHRPDLNEVRKKINRINDALVRSLAATGPERAQHQCRGAAAAAAAQVRHERRLDHLHAVALTRSLRSVCG